MQDKEELTTLVKLENRLTSEGFTRNFRVADGRLHTFDSDSEKSYGVEEVRIVNFYRFEGETDPDDMSILYAIECNDGTKGTISNSYGPKADSDVDEFLKEVEDTGKKINKSV